MKRLLVVLLLTLSGCATSMHAECAKPGVESLDAVVRIATSDGGGSGLVVGLNRVLTAAHVVVDTDVAFVGFRNEFERATVLAIDLETDLAMLEVSTGNYEPLQLSRTGLFSLEPVWAVGFPMATRKHTLTTGEFTNMVDGAVYTTAGIESGSSGGGLLRCEAGQYQLAGMLRGYGARWMGDRYINTGNVSVAVPASDIEAFVQFCSTVF